MIELSQQVLPHGITLSCRSAGEKAQGGRPVLVFLHGFPEAAFVWDELLLHFAKPENGGYRCIAPNLRGFELSSAPTDVSAYRPKHLVQDIAALIKLECEGERSDGPPLASSAPSGGREPHEMGERGGVVLVAHDWGGAVAWNLAASQPQLIKKLAIINSPHPGTFLRELQHSPTQQAASAYMNFLIRPDAERLLAEDDFRRLFEFFMPFSSVKGTGGDVKGSRVAPSWLTAEVRAQYRDVWQRGLTGPLNFYRASPLRPGPEVAKVVIPRELLEVHLPTLVLWGMGDIALPPALLDGLADYVPNMQLERIEGATHWIIHEQPALVAQHLQRYLQS
jgi:epoxide hydrolase 4